MSCTRLVISLVLAGNAAPAPAQPTQFVISSVAGSIQLLTAPVPALSVAIGSLQGMATDPTGNVYFTAQMAVGNTDFLFRLDQSGMLNRIAGYSWVGYSGDGGPAIDAQFNGARGVVLDRSGNAYIADSLNNRVRRVSSDGTITTAAGTGAPGSSGDGGPAINATLNEPWLLAIDAVGNLYIGEIASRIRKISTDGIITTVAGNGSYGYSGDGGPATTSQIGRPGGLAIDQAGNLYISDNFAVYDDDGDVYMAYARVRMVSPDGLIRTIAGGGDPGYSGDGGPATSAQLTQPGALAADAAGNVYVADGSAFGVFAVTAARVRRVSTDGTISTIAGNGSIGYSGDGGPAAGAQLGSVSGLATDSAGNLYIADSTHIRKISQAGIITTVVGGDSVPGGAALGDGGPANNAPLNAPTGVAVDSTGVVYIADTVNNRVRRVSADGIITTIDRVGTVNWPAGLAIDPGGNLYIVDSGYGRIRMLSTDGILTTVAGSDPGYSGDGGPAVAARLSWPKDIALDSSGNFYIADTGNNRIRVVTAAGVIATMAGNGVACYSGDGGPAVLAGLNAPSGLVVDSSGSVYIADTNAFRVRKVSPSGLITTLAGNGTRGSSGDGGPAAKAQLTSPVGLKLDSAGNLYIADGASVRMVSPAGIITTVAGTGVQGFSGDGGPATSALLGAWGLALDGTGNLYVADPWGSVVRLLRRVGQ